MSFVPIDPDAELTPAELDRHLKLLRNELATSQLELRRARDRELSAKKTYMQGRTKLLLSPECPKVSRKETGVTVDERDAWLSDQLDDELWVYEATQVERTNAEEYMRSLRDQVKCIQSLGANARQAYDISGRVS